MTLAMSHTRRVLRLPVWGVPLIYSALAVAAGLNIPRLEGRLFQNLVSPMSTGSATAIYSSIASGMIALSGIVFSLAFVMIQFSATAYSPRLVLWITRDPVMSNALGVFTATFLYAVAALTGVDRNNSGKVPIVSVYIVLGLLLASVAMFVALVYRLGLLQINRMLAFTGEEGRKVIQKMYPPLVSDFTTNAFEDLSRMPVTQTLLHHGPPLSIQAIDGERMRELAERADAVIEVLCAVGDTLTNATPLLHVRGATHAVEETDLRRAIELGDERTFEQDPKYVLRLLVDIAIKALSPAINDPTTAVQALDQIQDLLLRLGRAQLDLGKFRDASGKLRVVIPFPAWEDFLRLAFDEICFCGASSIQVMRRMRALVSDLISVLPEQRHPALHHWKLRLKSTVARSFTDTEEQQDASMEDRQGLGVPR